MAQFKGKVVLVTGASSGIGAGTAVDFARQGATLAITGRNAENLERTRNQCMEAGASATQVLAVTGDLTKEEDVNKVVDAVIDKFGTLHVLVNNAGALYAGGLSSTTLEDFDTMYHTNVRSVIMITKKAMPKIIENKGAIVNTSSIAGCRPVSSSLAYAMMKAAINQFTHCLAMELAPSGVRVNAVAPGTIDTPIFVRPGAHMSHQPEKIDDFYASCADLHPLGRVGSVDEVSSATLFLASDAASFTTGAIMRIDGGYCCTVSRSSMKLAGE